MGKKDREKLWILLDVLLAALLLATLIACFYLYESASTRRDDRVVQPVDKRR
jgi:flagellar basal body-associated protein FliL